MAAQKPIIKPIIIIIMACVFVFSTGWYVGFRMNTDPWMRAVEEKFETYCTYHNYEYHTRYSGSLVEEINYSYSSDSNLTMPLWLY